MSVLVWGPVQGGAMNNFEQVSSNAHQVRLAMGARGLGAHVWRGLGMETGCTVRFNASWVMVTWEPHGYTNGQTRLKTLPSQIFVDRR